MINTFLQSIHITLFLTTAGILGDSAARRLHVFRSEDAARAPACIPTLAICAGPCRPISLFNENLAAMTVHGYFILPVIYAHAIAQCAFPTCRYYLPAVGSPDLGSGRSGQIDAVVHPSPSVSKSGGQSGAPDGVDESLPVPISGGSSLVPLRTTCDLGSERIVVLSSCLLTSSPLLRTILATTRRSPFTPADLTVCSPLYRAEVSS